jgi:hypothetical protein
MASCEKCWGDAFDRMITTGKDQAEYYHDLIIERKDNPCTPEEQAGEDAKLCLECKRKTVHQYTHCCVNSDCKKYYQKV